MSRPVLGVLGGMGPAATALFIEMLAAFEDAPRDQDHLDAIVTSRSTLPSRIDAAVDACVEAALLDGLRHDARLLERMGAHVLAMPCNAAHRWHAQVAAACGIPVLNMVEEAVASARAAGVRTLGVLATGATIGAGLYRKACARRGMAALSPGPECQTLVERLVYGQVKAGSNGSDELFDAAVGELARNGCDGVALACTELSVYAHRRTAPLPRGVFVDAMGALACAAIAHTGGSLNKSAGTVYKSV